MYMYVYINVVSYDVYSRARSGCPMELSEEEEEAEQVSKVGFVNDEKD